MVIAPSISGEAVVIATNLLPVAGEIVSNFPEIEWGSAYVT
jgi:hypothetical protein